MGTDCGAGDERCCGENGEGEERLAFLFGEANGGGGGGLGRAEGVQERGDRNFEIDGVGGPGGLDDVVLEEGFLGSELGGKWTG